MKQYQLNRARALKRRATFFIAQIRKETKRRLAKRNEAILQLLDDPFIGLAVNYELPESSMNICKFST